jgi:hypothetical protein
LKFVAIGLMPNISFAIRIATKHNVESKKVHYQDVSKIMKYFKGVSNLAFTYGESSHDNDLPTYSDINYVRLNIDNKTI